MKKRGSRLFYTLAAVLAAPILILGIILVGLGIQSVSEGMELEIKRSLAGVARESIVQFVQAYPEEIQAKNGRFYAGTEDMTGQYELIDRIKKNTGADITVFYGNTRIITTIVNSSGNRIVGTMQTDPKVTDVAFAGEEYFSNSVMINGQPYYGYYVPLSYDNQVCGMLFAGVSNASVNQSTKAIVRKIMIVFLVALIAFLALASMFAKSIVTRLGQIRNYIGGLAENRYEEELPAKLLHRKDEIGDMGRYAIEVGNKVKTLISVDPLTGLLNRRAGQMILEEYIQKCEEEQTKLTLAMADIDFFKQVNDQYGHKYGDVVLTKISEVLRCRVGEQGFISRWGGEEFLLGFPTAKEEVLPILKAITGEISETEFSYKDKDFFVTITIGVVEYKRGDSMQHLVNRADKKLYQGKNEGRNCIVE